MSTAFLPAPARVSGPPDIVIAGAGPWGLAAAWAAAPRVRACTSR